MLDRTVRLYHKRRSNIRISASFSMTAVASPPSVQSGPRLGWYSSGNGGQGLSSMETDEVSRVFMPRKSVQRSDSSSSLNSNSSTSTVAATPQNSTAGQNSNAEGNSWSSSKKKASRNIWPSSKSEPVSGVTNARPQAVPAFSAAGPVASSAMSAIHQPSPVVPSQHMLQSQQNGARTGSAPSGDTPAILTLYLSMGRSRRNRSTSLFSRIYYGLDGKQTPRRCPPQ